MKHILAAVLLASTAFPANAEADIIRRADHSRCVALTFDDGPHPEFTNIILDVLADREIPATFFLVGENVEAYPETARRIVAEGHEVGNHSWNHPRFTRLTDYWIRDQIARTDAVIEAVLGFEPQLIRPPYGAGARNLSGLVDRPIILWDFATYDWLHKDGQFIINHVDNIVEGGAIILMHDVQEVTATSLNRVIDVIIHHGLGFSTITDLINGVPCEITIPNPSTR